MDIDKPTVVIDNVFYQFNLGKWIY